MTTKSTITIGTHDDVVAAIVSACRCKVMAARDIDDEASEVYVQAVDHYEYAGQVADYSHAITLDDARQHGAGAIVETYYVDADAEWHTTVTPVDRYVPMGAVLQVVRERIDARERKAAAQRRAEADAQAAIERAEREQVVAAVTAVAERRWPGRCKVWVAGQGLESRYVVGRWDAPAIPGYGTPDQTYSVMFCGNKFVLVGADDTEAEACTAD